MTGANRAGLPLLFVTDGIHAADMRAAEGGLDADKARAFLSDAGATADHLIASLAW